MCAAKLLLREQWVTFSREGERCMSLDVNVFTSPLGIVHISKETGPTGSSFKILIIFMTVFMTRSV